MAAACCVYDWRRNDFKGLGHEEIEKWMKEWCKKWAFQKEKGAGGIVHWQGRFSLKVKERIGGVQAKLGWEVDPARPYDWYLAATSAENRDNLFYVMKDDTRLEGPWTDRDEYVPKQIRDIKEWYPWIKSAELLLEVWSTRWVYCIIDPRGDKGKSTFCLKLRCEGKASIIPFCNDFQDLMQLVCCQPKRGCYCIDIPRGISKEKLGQMWGAIETIKSGYAFDKRYHFKDETFDCPCIFVFMNVPPDQKYLSPDRWKLLTIDEHMELVPWKEEVVGVPHWLKEEALKGVSLASQAPGKLGEKPPSFSLTPGTSGTPVEKSDFQDRWLSTPRGGNFGNMIDTSWDNLFGGS